MSLVKTFLFFTYIMLSTIYSNTYGTFTVMLDPAGDAAHAGRSIDGCFERGLTLQFTEHLKTRIENTFPSVRVVLTRFPGETLQPLQNANFANRLQVDAYISIHFYHERAHKSELYLYTYTHGQEPVCNKNTPSLSFVTYDQAHLLARNMSSKFADNAYKVFSQSCYHSLFTVKEGLQVPFKPLVGIIAPALGIEVGIRQQNDWISYLDAFTDMIGTLAHNENRT